MHRSVGISLLGLAALASASPAWAADQTALTTNSPFLPPAGSAAAVAPTETLEFTGVSVLPKQTLVSVFNTQEKRGRWIPVGSSLDGIEVVSYDAAHDQTVVRYGGQLKILTLRIPGKVANATSTVAVQPPVSTTSSSTAPNPSTVAAAAPAAPKKPLTLAQQEEEARMFVADMLDLGMQSRKAYEEALKKAAAEKAAAKNAPPTAQPVVVSPSGG